jgi:hypothetical protein
LLKPRNQIVEEEIQTPECRPGFFIEPNLVPGPLQGYGRSGRRNRAKTKGVSGPSTPGGETFLRAPRSLSVLDPFEQIDNPPTQSLGEHVQTRQSQIHLASFECSDLGAVKICFYQQKHPGSKILGQAVGFDADGEPGQPAMPPEDAFAS